MSHFKTTRGEAAFLAAYDAAMQSWPVPFAEIDIPGRFGITHIVASGPPDAPPLVLLHGYWSTLAMWTPNIADLSKDHRVYAVDVMGQPGRSIPGEPIRNPSGFVAWLTEILNGLHLDRATLVGMSYGGWLALNYAVAVPERVQNLVLLSPAASLLPIVRQFSLRGTLMMLIPTRFTVNSFMRWLRLKDNPGDAATRRLGDQMVDLIYLGIKHFRIQKSSSGVMPTVFSDAELRAMPVPTLLLVGGHEVIYDPAAALARGRRLIPDFEGHLVPRSSHDMCFSQPRVVDRRILDFLTRKKAESETDSPAHVAGAAL